MTTATRTAAFTTGPDGILMGLNRAAEQLLEIRIAEALGRKCHEVMAGRDLFGNSYCVDGCPISRMARHGAAIRPFRLDVANPSGESLALRVSVVAVGGTPRAGPCLVHFLEPVAEGPLGCLEADLDESFPGARDRRLDHQTSREVEVLRLLASGVKTDDAAAMLGISAATVRSYVKGCFHKLEAHTCLEAVRLAERLGRLDEGPRS